MGVVRVAGCRHRHCGPRCLRSIERRNNHLSGHPAIRRSTLPSRHFIRRQSTAAPHSRAVGSAAGKGEGEGRGRKAHLRHRPSGYDSLFGTPILLHLWLDSSCLSLPSRPIFGHSPDGKDQACGSGSLSGGGDAHGGTVRRRIHSLHRVLPLLHRYGGRTGTVHQVRDSVACEWRSRWRRNEVNG
jgi:hypothetical protein